MANDKDTLKEALEEFELCAEAEQDNRRAALEDIKFTFLDEQWLEADKKNRERDRRPCLTINKTRQFVKQVVNSGRRNKPSIKVHPADSNADPKTAEVINGLIRNIEYTSNADVAYDTGFEFAVAGGFGYWRISADYACDDSFDMDLRIDRIANPFAVYGDYMSTAADSSDWNRAYITDPISRKEFETRWKGADKVDWQMGPYADLPTNWKNDERIIIAERWTRSEVTKKIIKLSDGRVVQADWYMGKVPGEQSLKNSDILSAMGIEVTGERDTKSYKVKQQIMTGAEILETNEWLGKYIPLVPVYGEELNIEGKRHFRSLIRSGKDAARAFNYWRTVTTELIALAPKTPFIGKVGQFDTDADKWASANVQSHAYIEYDDVQGAPPPQRQPFAGVPAGPLQEAMNASDDMKAIYGMYDASMGARSNETSGVAINQRKQQGDNSNFHFVDNQARAIGHTGRILIDLIPHYYSQERVIRVMGADSKPKNVQITSQQVDGTQEMYNLALGKYDLTVDTGPGFATQREEAAYQMTEFIRAFPAAAPIIGDLLAKNQDWPEADEIAKRLQALLPPQVNGQNPQVQQLQQVLQQTQQQGEQAMQQLRAEVEKLNGELRAANQDRAIDGQKLDLDRRKLDIEAFKADTDRLEATAAGMTPDMVQAIVMQTLQNALRSPDITPQEQTAAAPQAPQVQQPMPQQHAMPDGQMMLGAEMPQMPPDQMQDMMPQMMGDPPPNQPPIPPDQPPN